MNLIIPMAGDGSRFLNKGYTTIKPLIEFNGKPMIENVIEPFKKFNKISKIIAIVRQDHVEDFDLVERLKCIIPDIAIVVLSKRTEGAACSILEAEKYINNDEELAICNCDNIIQVNSLDIDAKGKIYTFEDASLSTKWSYVKIDYTGMVTEVQEKKPISTHATAGLYLWKHGSDFVNAAKSMISQNIRYNNEFYLAPVYNENIKCGHRIEIENVISVDIVGTPEDLGTYLKKSS